MSRQGVIAHYRARLPLPDDVRPVTLLEGDTPLIEAPSLAAHLGLDARVFLKYEGLNPTCSFKDRGMTMAISKAKEAGCEAVICASTGNTSAAAAAYARRGGMRAFVLIPDGYVAQGKLAQALVYGAEVLAIRGNFDRALDIVREAAEKYPVTLVNSVNPYRLQGQKTAAFEIVDALGDAPAWLCLPIGNAGTITAPFTYFSNRWPPCQPPLALCHFLTFFRLFFGAMMEKPSACLCDKNFSDFCRDPSKWSRQKVPHHEPHQHTHRFKRRRRNTPRPRSRRRSSRRRRHHHRCRNKLVSTAGFDAPPRPRRPRRGVHPHENNARGNEDAEQGRHPFHCRVFRLCVCVNTHVNPQAGRFSQLELAHGPNTSGT